jgi:D-glycero-D-manno-heptose 1,7-bisphosphate phosphatase
MTQVTPIRTASDGILRLFFSEPTTTGSSPAIFLDRDGIINERIHGGYVTQWSEFRFIKGIAQQLAEVSKLGLPMIVVSNQAGVGKGLITPEALVEITERFVSALRSRGAGIDAVYYCPHVVEAHCLCRKPAPGLLQAAARDWQIDLKQSVLVGDSASDIEAAQNSQCRAILMDQGDRQSSTQVNSGQPAIIVQKTNDIVAGIRNLLRTAEIRRTTP